jgi:hypothetical protein
MNRTTTNEREEEVSTEGRNFVELLSLLLIVFFLAGMFIKFLFF